MIRIERFPIKTPYGETNIGITAYVLNKNMIRRQIPNLITLLNLLSGSIAAILAVQNYMVAAAFFVALGIFFDFFDGLAARLLKVSSPLGLQLDSLADMVTSGLVPGIVMFQLFTQSVENQPKIWNFATSNHNLIVLDFPPIALLGLLITLASGYRLAKFNVDQRQTSGFIGLPTPANAILILGLPLILIFHPSAWVHNVILNSWFLAFVTIFSCVMLNAELPLFALKFKTWGLKENWFRYSFLLLALLGLLFLHFFALPLIIVFYVLLSLFVARRS